VDVRLLRAPLPVFDLFAAAQITATRWMWRQQAPQLAAQRERSELRVYEAAVARRTGTEGLTLAVGRIAPWYTPGLVALDGAQVGWCNAGCSLELGVFGGGVPDAVTFAPDASYWTAGVYGRLQHRTGELLLYDATRLALLVPPDGPARYELETQLGVETPRFSLNLGPRLGMPTSGDLSRATLDGLQLDLAVRPTNTVRVIGGGRWQRADTAWQDGLDLVLGGHRAHGDLGVYWDASPTLTVGASSGAVYDADLERAQVYAGPEVSLPRLLGPRGGLSLGYQRELGLYPGETAWVQTALRLSHRATLLLRPFWARDVDGTRATEAGLATRLDLGLNDWLSLRLSALARSDVGGTVIDDRPWGLWALASLTGSL
jgi:hypothetical protein